MMDLDISFGEKTMTTLVHIKMDAEDPLLLSEGVCHELEIITYHPGVEIWHDGQKDRKNHGQDQTATKVPAMRVR